MNAAARKPVEIDAALLADAWEWVLRLRQENASQDDIVAWLAWYEADARHRQAYDEMQAFWQQSGRIVEEPDPLPSSWWLGGESDAGAAIASSGRVAAKPPRRGRWPALASAAALAMVAVGARMLTVRQAPPIAPSIELALPPPAPLVEDTTLPDGSRVELAAKSSISLAFTDAQRKLTLRGGAAYFSVAHNRARPFIVEVGHLNVRAVGTAFNIREAGARVVVTVTEGAVEVSALGGRGGAVRVKAGSEIVWSANAGPTIAAVDTAHELAWRQGRLDYLNEPLASAVADINRYSRQRVVLGDAAVGRIVFSGTVLTRDAEAWIRALPDSFPVDVRVNGAGDLVLSSRASAAAGAREPRRD